MDEGSQAWERGRRVRAVHAAWALTWGCLSGGCCGFPALLPLS